MQCACALHTADLPFHCYFCREIRNDSHSEGSVLAKIKWNQNGIVRQISSENWPLQIWWASRCSTMCSISSWHETHLWNESKTICALDRKNFDAAECWLRRKRTQSIISTQAEHRRTKGKDKKNITLVTLLLCNNKIRPEVDANGLVFCCCCQSIFIHRLFFSRIIEFVAHQTNITNVACSDCDAGTICIW